MGYTFEVNMHFYVLSLTSLIALLRPKALIISESYEHFALSQ